ncbi:MAG: tetratricopeptide repeat protein [Myxococcaceae bacterium]
MRVRLALLVALSLLAGGCKKDAADHLRAAKDQVFEKHPEEGLREYRLALDSLERDTSAESQVYRARALRGAADVYYLELRDMRKAVEVYRELIQQCPEAPETLEGRIHLAEILRRHYRDVRGAISELTAAVARNPPQSAELNYQVAKLYFELADYEQCEIESLGVERRYETSAFVDDAMLLRGQALSMRDGHRAEAKRVFQELADRFPESELQPHALYEVGKLRADSGELEKAIEAWVEALKRHPDPAVVQLSISKVRHQMKSTTPRHIGDHNTAFDRPPAVVAAQAIPVKVPPAKTSAEAAGGTAEEAASELKMPAMGPPATKQEKAPEPVKEP